jgi:hypothetical protein
VFEKGFKSWCETTSKKFRRELKVAAGDPLDARMFAAHLNITLWSLNDIPDLDAQTKIILTKDSRSWSAATISSGGEHLIIYNPVHSKARTSSNIMHEISHIVIGHEPARVDVSEDNIMLLNTYDKTQEEEADWLCGCLLLPREAALKIKRSKLADSKAAELYGISLDMLKYRMNVTGANKLFKNLRSL